MVWSIILRFGIRKKTEYLNGRGINITYSLLPVLEGRIPIVQLDFIVLRSMEEYLGHRKILVTLRLSVMDLLEVQICLTMKQVKMAQ